MRKARTIIGLQIAFLICALIFSTSSLYQNIAMHNATSSLDAIRKAFKEGAPDKAMAQDKRTIESQIMEAAEPLKAEQKPGNVIAELKDINGFLVGIDVPGKGKGCVVMARQMPAQPILGVVTLTGVSKDAGVFVGLPTEDWLKGLVGKASSAGERLIEVPLVVERPVAVRTAVEAGTALQLRAEAVVIAPPPAAQIPALYAMVTRSFGEELGLRIIAPSKVESWEETFGALTFSKPVFQGAEKATQAKATTTVEAARTPLEGLAAELATPEAITGPQARVTAAFAYPGIYVREEDMKYAGEEGITYSLMVLPPITIGQESIKTKGMYLTNPVIIRPLNAPVIVCVQEHMKTEQVPYRIPEAEELTSESAMKEAERAMLEAIGTTGYLIAVKPGQPFVIPAGAGHTIINPTAQPALIEALTSAEQKALSAPYERFHGGLYRVTTVEGKIGIEENPEYVEHYELVPARPELATAEFQPAIKLEAGRSLYSLISRKELGTSKLGELLREGKISGPLAPELQGYEQRGTLAMRRVTEEAEIASVFGLPVTLKAASAGSVIEVTEGGVSKLTKGERTTTMADLTVTKRILQEMGIELLSLPVGTPEEAAAFLAEKLKPEALGKVAELAKTIKAAPSVEAKEAVIAGIKEVGEAMAELPTGEAAAVVPLAEGKIALHVMPAKAAAVIEGEAFKPGEIENIKKGTSHQIVICDLDTLVVQQGKTPDGKPVYAPAVHAISMIANLDKTRQAGLHVGVISSRLNTLGVLNVLQQAGLPASIFEGIYGDVVNAQAMTEVVNTMKERLEKVYSTNIPFADIIFSIAEANKDLLAALSNAKLGVLVQTIMTPKKGQYISQKDSLIAAIKALSLEPQVKQGLIDAINRAEKIQGVEAAKEDKYESIEQMRDTLLENV